MGLFDKLTEKHSTDREGSGPSGSQGLDTGGSSRRIDKKPAIEGVTSIVTKKDIDDAFAVAERLVGKPLPGIRGSVANERDHFVIKQTSGLDYHILFKNIEWVVFTQGGSERLVWSTEYDEYCQQSKKILLAVYPMEEELDLKFSHEQLDLDRDIKRRHFDSAFGRFVIHTRRAEGGTDVCLERNNGGRSFLLIYHNLTTLQLEPRGEADSLPF